MENFCLYNGKKIAKLETWDITSVELSSDYTSVIVQAESKSNKSEYTLDITSLISNQYADGLDPYAATIVNELTGVSDWVLDSDNNRIKYTKPQDPNVIPPTSEFYYVDNLTTKKFNTPLAAFQSYMTVSNRCSGYPDYTYTTTVNSSSVSYFVRCSPALPKVEIQLPKVDNPNYDPNVEQEQETLPLEVVAQQVISNAESGDSSAQQAIISAFNNITDGILTSDYSEFFEQNKQPK